MREMVKTYPLENEIVLYIERLHYMVESTRVLLSSFASRTEFPVSPDKYQELLQEFRDAYAELSMTLRKVYRNTVDAKYLDASYYEQEVDFEFGEIQIYSKEGLAREGCADGGCVQQSTVRGTANSSQP